MKDGGGILQFSFRAENDEKFSAKRFFNLSRMIFRLAEIDFSFTAERFLYILLLHLACQYLLAQESVDVNGTLEIKTGPCVL